MTSISTVKLPCYQSPYHVPKSGHKCLPNKHNPHAGGGNGNAGWWGNHKCPDPINTPRKDGFSCIIDDKGRTLYCPPKNDHKCQPNKHNPHASGGNGNAGWWGGNKAWSGGSG
jgi:hypothetical protein